jgi:thiamine kinase-like enzyme
VAKIRPDQFDNTDANMQMRQPHQQEVQSFLQRHLGGNGWEFALPEGSGKESYFARSHAVKYFIKLGVEPSRYQVAADMGLTPPVLATGHLHDGVPILVQSFVEGRTPSRKDYRDNLEQVAAIIRRLHQSPELQRALPDVASDLYSVAGLKCVADVRKRWVRYRAQVPKVAAFVDDSLAGLSQQVQAFQGKGLVAAHNDICNANWLISSDGQFYLLDFDAMSKDDPAVDLGALLWWYYRPELWHRFLEIVGYAGDPEFQRRMRVRMAMHCLQITLPREHSFDEFYAGSYADELTDFRAILSGKENPEGYE